jgi:hypothetical protein
VVHPLLSELQAHRPAALPELLATAKLSIDANSVGTATQPPVSSWTLPAAGPFASPPPDDNVRVYTTQMGTVLSGGTKVCTCLVVEMLRTYLPSCPATEIVEEQGLLLVDAVSHRVVRSFREDATVGTVFGNC